MPHYYARITSISNMRKQNNPHEAFWVREFVETLLADTDLLVSDGESVCKDTRVTSSGCIFDRRVDMIVAVHDK